MSERALSDLPVPALIALAALLETYAPGMPPAHRVHEIAGDRAAAITAALSALSHARRDMRQVAEMCRFGAETAARAVDNGLIDLVLSGAQAEGVPTRDTAAVVQSLLASAQCEVTIAGYAFYDGKNLFAGLAERMAVDSGIKVRLLIDVRRSANDTTIADQVVARTMRDFWKRQWPWSPRPEVYFDPRALELNPATRAAMHAKFVIVDRAVALITSANFTPAAQRRNVEVGVLINNPLLVARLQEFADSLCAGMLQRTASSSDLQSR